MARGKSVLISFLIVALTCGPALADGRSDAQAGLVALRRGDNAGAVVLFNKAIASGVLAGPALQLVLAKRSQALLAVGDRAGSNADARRALALAPRDPAAQALVAQSKPLPPPPPPPPPPPRHLDASSQAIIDAINSRVFIGQKGESLVLTYRPAQNRLCITRSFKENRISNLTTFPAHFYADCIDINDFVDSEITGSAGSLKEDVAIACKDRKYCMSSYDDRGQDLSKYMFYWCVSGASCKDLFIQLRGTAR